MVRKTGGESTNPEHRIEGICHRGGKSMNLDYQIEFDTVKTQRACEGMFGGSHRCVDVLNESEML